MFKKQTCASREDGAVIHRTRPLFLKPKGASKRHPGYFIGSACACRKVILTENGNQSPVTRVVGTDVRTIVPTISHRRRVQAVGQ